MYILRNLNILFIEMYRKWYKLCWSVWTSINLNSMQNTILLLEVFVLEYGVKSLAPHIGELGGGPRAPPAEGAPMSTRTGTTL